MELANQRLISTDKKIGILNTLIEDIRKLYNVIKDLNSSKEDMLNALTKITYAWEKFKFSIYGYCYRNKYSIENERVALILK